MNRVQLTLVLACFVVALHAQSQAGHPVTVRVSDHSGPIPARITIVDAAGRQPRIAPQASAPLAVRPGVVYTATGEASFELAPGEYTVWASRGVEYDAQRRDVRVPSPAASQPIELRLTRAIDIPGWSAGDVHLHTFELSRHGDATLRERAITLAGEGLDFAVSTEHNLAAAFEDEVRAAGLRDHVTPITGTELTTPLGHFNLFPLRAGGSLPDPTLDWSALWAAIDRDLRPAVAILNHPRDVHEKYRPFDDAHYLSSVGEMLNGRDFPGNAIEVVNSGAMQSDPLRPVRDWLMLLDRGGRIAGIGSSDSHDVAAIHVGQARTYVKAARSGGPPQADDVAAAIGRGETMVSYGLVTSLEVSANGRAQVRVYGPPWNRARQLLLFSNGQVVEQRAITDPGRGGLKWSGALQVPSSGHDAWLAAVAVGDNVQLPFWSVAKPYQPSGDTTTSMTLGISQAIAFDGNRDGRFESARAIAERLLAEAGDREPALASGLDRHDKAVAAQAAFLLAKLQRLDRFLASSAARLRPATREAMAQVQREIAQAGSR